MKNVLFGFLLLVVSAANAHALDARCQRITEVDAEANKVRALISENLTLSAKELSVRLNELTDETQDLTTAVLGCDDYFDDVLTQTAGALARVREARL